MLIPISSSVSLQADFIQDLKLLKQYRDSAVATNAINLVSNAEER